MTDEEALKSAGMVTTATVDPPVATEGAVTDSWDCLSTPGMDALSMLNHPQPPRSALMRSRVQATPTNGASSAAVNVTVTMASPSEVRGLASTKAPVATLCRMTPFQPVEPSAVNATPDSFAGTAPCALPLAICTVRSPEPSRANWGERSQIVFMWLSLWPPTGSTCEPLFPKSPLSPDGGWSAPSLMVKGTAVALGSSSTQPPLPLLALRSQTRLCQPWRVPLLKL